MAVFNRTLSVDSLFRGVGVGRRIFCSASGGNDTTGDGSRAFPYATIARAAQDLRSGHGDVVFVQGTGTPAFPSSQPQVNITGINNFAIVGLGSAFIGNVSGTAGGMKTVTAWAHGGGNATATIGAGHGLVTGDHVFVRGVAQTGSVRINGPARVVGAGASTVTLQVTNPGTAGDQPYTGGATGNLQISNFGFYGCSDVLLFNLSIGAGILVANGWGGAAFTNQATVAPSRNIFISGCTISNASLGFIGMPPTPDIEQGGSNLAIERCTFAVNQILASSPLADFSHIYVAGGKNWQITENVFNSLALGGDPQYPGVIRHLSVPGIGLVCANNQWGTAVPQDQRAFADAEADVDNVFYRRNFFVAGFSTPEPMDAAGDVFDTEPAQFIGQDLLNTQSDLIWRQPTQTAIADPGSMGELVARTAFQGAVHIDTTGAGSSGTAFPTGTPENPVDNITDARTIADAQGFTKYVLNGAVTVAVDHLNWTFEGVGDAGATVWTFANTCDMTGSSFFQCTILGDLTGSGRASYQEALIGEVGGTVLGLQGILNTVGTFGTIRVAAGGTIEGTEVASRDLINGTILDFNGAAATIGLANVQGIWSVVNNTNALGVFGAALAGALLTVAASNTSGIYILLGYGEVTDSKVGAVSYLDNVLHGSALHNVVNATSSRALIDTSTTPWTEVRYIYDEENASDSVVWETYELYDQDGTALAGDKDGGNNPLVDPTRLIAERRRV